MGTRGQPGHDDELLGTLRRVAAAIGTEVLTSSAYDGYRLEHEPNLPSSTMIRSRFGAWRPAVRAAGLLALGDAGSESERELSRVVRSLRDARSALPMPLTRANYARWHSALGASEERPDVDEIVAIFGNWERALNAAGIGSDDILHPDALWTSAEARAIRRFVETVTGEPLSASAYAALLERERHQPLPSWDVLCELLAM